LSIESKLWVQFTAVFLEFKMTMPSESNKIWTELARENQARVLGFVLVCILPAVSAWVSMRSVAATTFRIDTYSHIPLIPVVSFYLIYSERKRIFSQLSSGWKVGGLLLLGGVACFVFGQLNLWATAPGNALSVEALGIILAWAGAFALFFGLKALRAASFPFLFLIFMVPIPEPFLSRTIFLLQEGSSTVAAFLFNLFGVPFLREGFDFSLPGVTIRVAEECSGIRSTLALLIMSVLAGHILLRKFWYKTVLCVLVFPLAVFKNGLRIVTLSTLAVYVDAGFLQGRLHQYGGIVFFAAGLVPLALFLLLFRKKENTKHSSLETRPSEA
jgi:exosortase